MNRACSLKEKTPEFTQKKGEIHELFVLWALSLVWFASATPDIFKTTPIPNNWERYGIKVGVRMP